MMNIFRPVIHALVAESRPARLVVLARQELDLVDKIEAILPY